MIDFSLGAIVDENLGNKLLLMEVPTKGLSSCSCSQNKHTSFSNSMMEIWIHQGLDGIDICVTPDILSVSSTFYQCIDDL